MDIKQIQYIFSLIQFKADFILMFLDLTFLIFYILLCYFIFIQNISMAEESKFWFEAWKEYLKADKDMRERWKSLVDLWENVKEDLKNTLQSAPKAAAMRRKRELTERNIFDIINTAKQRPNFKWQRKMIWNEEDERHEYVIQCLNPSSDFLFRKIKEERWVTNMHWESINKYLQPVANQIWALKAAVTVSVTPETSKTVSSYENIKMHTSQDKKEVEDLPEGNKDEKEVEDLPEDEKDDKEPIIDGPEVEEWFTEPTDPNFTVKDYSSHEPGEHVVEKKPEELNYETDSDGVDADYPRWKRAVHGRFEVVKYNCHDVDQEWDIITHLKEQKKKKPKNFDPNQGVIDFWD